MLWEFFLLMVGAALGFTAAAMMCASGRADEASDRSADYLSARLRDDEPWGM